MALSGAVCRTSVILITNKNNINNINYKNKRNINFGERVVSLLFTKAEGWGEKEIRT